MFLSILSTDIISICEHKQAYLCNNIHLTHSKDIWQPLKFILSALQAVLFNWFHN